MNQLETEEFLEIKMETEDGSHLQGFFSLQKEFGDNKQTDFLLWRTMGRRIKGKALSVFVARVIFGVTDKHAHTYPQMREKGKLWLLSLFLRERSQDKKRCDLSR